MKKSNKLIIALLLTALFSAGMICRALPSAVDVSDVAIESEMAIIMSEEFSGEGTQESPYIIKNASEFISLSGMINTGVGTEAHYELVCDIDLEGAVLTPAGTKESPFKGTFDGNGHTIKNFVISGSEYCGIFGYTLNAVIKNFYLDGIDVVLTAAASGVTNSYVGPAVAYAHCEKGNSLISGICVNDTEIKIDGVIKYVYAGGVTGCVYSKSSGVMRVENCYSRCALSVENLNGYAYAGGIAGRLSTGSGGDTRMMYCYSVGSVSAKSVNSSHAGGLAGYVWSHGSSYSDDVTLQGSAELMSDTDILISNCFAAASVYSKSTKYSSRAGRVGGHDNLHADCEKATTLYTKDASVTIDTVEELVVGTAVSIDKFKNAEYLSSTLGFDFENVWEIDADGGYEYPVFKDVKKVYNEDSTFDLLEVTTDVSLFAGNNKVTVSDVSFVNGNTLYLDRGTYVIDGISGDCKITASPNANVIVLGENKPEGYVEFDIGPKAASENIRYAEVLGNQYAFSEYNNKYGVVADENMLVEIVERTENGAVSSYYYVDSKNNTCSKLGLDGFMNTSDRRDIRLSKDVGIRYRADFSKAAKLEKTEYEITEYGFIISLESGISEESQLNFDLEKYVSGVAYDKFGTDLIFDNTNDEIAIVTGVLYGIPEAHYTTLLAAKPYAKIAVGEEEFVVYGEQVSESLYNMAKLYENSDVLTQEQKSIVDSIISSAEKV